MFLLHHASSLSEMWKKHENQKDSFYSLLNRYWTRFIWNWDVLLHGNPTVDLYNAIKLAGGGELGVGVGEEEWGSGEREVLEGFVGRTEGLLELVVGRYGDAPTQLEGDTSKTSLLRKRAPPWLGNGVPSRAEDGVIFSGTGNISKSSLTTVSQWMESIYQHGDAAYGIGENPSSRPKHRKKRRKMDKDSSRAPLSVAGRQDAQYSDPGLRSQATKGPSLHRKTAENNASSPGIPPPLVNAVDRSLDVAVAKADPKTAAAPGRERTHKPGKKDPQPYAYEPLVDTQKMMKYLTLGYGSSWTLNPKGFDSDASHTDDTDKAVVNSNGESRAPETSAPEKLDELEPTPELSDEEEPPFLQRLEESIGKFLVGLSGDLENTEFEDESNDETADMVTSHDVKLPVEVAKRIFLRTLTVEMSKNRSSQRASTEERPSDGGAGVPEVDDSEGMPTAVRSGDGPPSTATHARVQVAVYIHQPFIFVFLFQLHTSSLAIPGFYRAIHHTLGPLQQSLLRSTNPERWRERMRNSLGVYSGGLPGDSSGEASVPDSAAAKIYDMIFDPVKNTIRTSIPNIPLPGSIAAEGLYRSTQIVRPVTVSGSWYTLGIPVGSSTADVTSSPAGSALVKTDWTRIEALGVHIHALNIWAATRDKRGGLTDARPDCDKLERAVKTGRNWWVVWMKVPQKGLVASAPNHQCEKEAILVRKSPAEGSSTSRETSQPRVDGGRWLLREQPRSRGASGNGHSTVTASTAGAKGATEGVGVDARRWVEALVRLTE